MVNNIRFQRTQSGFGNAQVHALRFTFLRSDEDINAQFEEMARQIRAKIREYFDFGDEQLQSYLLEFEPADERATSTRQRTIRKLISITGKFLATIYTAMLHSNETLELEGFRITVKIMGRLMRTRVMGGSGRLWGMNVIPKHLKGKGLMAHPMYKTQSEPDTPCGIRAFLLGLEQDKYKGSLAQLIADSTGLGQAIGRHG